jgi:hypothetical protein
MADPFSLFAATAGLIQQLLQCGNYIKTILEIAGTLDEDVLGLTHEIATLVSVNESLQNVYEAEKNRAPSTSLADRRRIESLWQNVGTLVRDCHKTVEELENILLEIIGKTPSTISKLSDRLGGKIDHLKKSMRMEKKDDDFKKVHMRLLNYQSSQDSTDLSLGYFSQEIRLLGSRLRSEIAGLRPRLASADGTHVSIMLRAVVLPC